MIQQPQAAPQAQAAGTGAESMGTGMDMGQMMQYIQSLPEPERTQALEALSKNYGGLNDNLSEQLESAKMLRSQEGLEGKQIGNMYIAANPLAHLEQGIQKYQSAQDIKRLRGEKDELNNSYQSGIRGIQDAMLRG